MEQVHIHIFVADMKRNWIVSKLFFLSISEDAKCKYEPLPKFGYAEGACIIRRHIK